MKNLDTIKLVTQSGHKPHNLFQRIGNSFVAHFFADERTSREPACLSRNGLCYGDSSMINNLHQDGPRDLGATPRKLPWQNNLVWIAVLTTSTCLRVKFVIIRLTRNVSSICPYSASPRYRLLPLPEKSSLPLKTAEECFFHPFSHIIGLYLPKTSLINCLTDVFIFCGVKNLDTIKHVTQALRSSFRQQIPNLQQIFTNQFCTMLPPQVPPSVAPVLKMPPVDSEIEVDDDDVIEIENKD